MIYKKAIGSVVATALLLIVAVVSIVTFQNWFNTYSSSLQNEIESQSTNGLDTRINDVIGNTLYFKNGQNKNISVNRIILGGVDCNISQNISSGMNNLSLGECTNNLSTSTTEVVVYTDNGIYSQKIFLDSLTSSNSQNDGSSFSLDCSILPGEWSAVPGNEDLGTDDFCVMTYEAKNVSNTPTSQPSLTPWINITQSDARSACSSLGSGYHLITDAEWVTMARNIENVDSNWNSTTIGDGFMWRGHSDGTPDNRLSVSNTSDYYDQTGNSDSSNQSRVLELSTGDIVWDVAGNVWDMTNDTTSDTEMGTAGGSWYEWTSISGYNYLKSSNLSFNSSNGIGQVYTSTIANSVLLRGGSRLSFSLAGAFALGLTRSPEDSEEYMGFRCAYTN